jgi:hypothetical protein
MEVEVVSTKVVVAVDSVSNDADRNRRKGEGRIANQVGVTPASGINLLFGSEMSRVSDSVSQSREEDKDKYVEAAKLLSIQKKVGFNFEEATSDTIKHLIDQEKCDRTKKMEWEQKEGD